jgi:C-terminal processing protease CtpA/Prc
MKKAILLIVCVMIVTILSAQSDVKLNLGFEKITPGKKLPDKYFEWGKGYSLSIDSTIKHSGKYSVLIQPSETREPNSFGCIAYGIPAVYEGDSIELKAYMKLNNVSGGPIGLLLRLDGTSGSLKFDNMQQKNIQGTSDWTMYAVKLPLPKEARMIYFAAMLSGTGQIWVDDFELLIDGKDISQAKTREIVILPAEKDKEFDKGSKIEAFKATEKQIYDLKMLGMVWGFLKYYHPNIAAGNFNWDYELFRILPKVIQSKNQQDRDAILSDWIKSLGNFEVTTESENKNKEVKISPDLEWITNSNLATNLSLQLIQIKNARRINENYYVTVAGVGNPDFSNERPYLAMKYPDTGFRLLSLYRYWNTIQYYFPYKNLIEEDWKLVLKEFVPRYVNASNEFEYKLAVLELIGRVHDTHAQFNPDQAINSYQGVYFALPLVKFIEDKVVVTGFYNQELGIKSGLKIGDVITSINNKPVEKIVSEQLKYFPGSNYPTQLRSIALYLLKSNDTTLNMEFIRNRKSESCVIKTYSRDNVKRDPAKKDTCFKMIALDIGYIYPGTIKNEYLPKIMREVQKTMGLIIDFRCYPSDFVVFTLGKYLMPESTAFVKFTRGNVTTPGIFTMDTEATKVGEKNPDYYKGKVIILVNEQTQSSAEYHSMAFIVAPKATVMGSTTAGADGNVSSIILPGGINTRISGIGVYYPDGRETQRIGIVPDIVVKPTIEGIKQGKDEVLDKAIEVIKGKVTDK